MKTVIGLGNPGVQHAGTRHNVGFEVVDVVAARLHLAFGPETGPALVARGKVGREPVELMKPQGFMNRSGESCARYWGGRRPEPADVLIVLDDLALAPGRLRFRARGSDGGHNGLRSMIAALGTREVSRLRIGIGSAAAEDWKEHVLAPIPAQERALIDGALERALEGVLGFLEGEDTGRLQERINAAPPPGETRRTRTPEAVARATPADATAGRKDVRGESQVDTRPHKYEGMFLLNHSKVPPESGDAPGFVSALLKKHDLKQVECDVWDERRLAYAIKGQKRGTYVLTYFEGSGERIEPLQRELNITEEVLRYLVVRHPNEFPPFPKVRREAKETRAPREGGRPEGGSAPARDKQEVPGSRPAKAPAKEAAKAPVKEPAKEPEQPAARSEEGGEKASTEQAPAEKAPAEKDEN